MKCVRLLASMASHQLEKYLKTQRKKSGRTQREALEHPSAGHPLPAFLGSIGAGPAQLGIIEGIAESVASFAKLLCGYIADRIPRRKPIVVSGYVVANAVKPLLALTSSWRQVLAIRFADRFAKGMRGTSS
jgi:MFS family permease